MHFKYNSASSSHATRNILLLIQEVPKKGWKIRPQGNLLLLF